MNHVPTQSLRRRPASAFHVVDWGLLPFRDAHERQRAALADRLAGRIDDTIFLVQHPHVYTCGRGADVGSLKLSDGIELVPVERGGGITYHGPGQLVAYPIMDVRARTGDLHRFLRWLEDVIITTIADWGLVGEHNPVYTGVWVGGRKIASIGIAVRQWVSYHGVALNVSTDLTRFAAIHPCGLPPETMTSMEQLTGRTISLDDVTSHFIHALGSTS